MDPKVADSLRRIREAAKQRVAEGIKKPLAKTNQLNIENLAKSIREQIATASSVVLSQKAAREYIGNISEDIRKSSTASLKKFQTPSKELNPDLYPNNCKLVCDHEDGGALIIEESPQLRTVFGQERDSTYRISLPYVVFVLGYNKQIKKDKDITYRLLNMGVGFRTTPLNSIEDRVSNPGLPHSTNTYVCQSLVLPNGKRASQFSTLKQMCEAFVYTYWNSKFHYSFETARCDFTIKDKKITSFAQWQKIEPLDILKANFADGMRVKLILDSFDRYRNAQINPAVSQLVNQIVRESNSLLSSDELSKLIIDTSEKIVEQVLQNLVYNHKK